MRLTFGEVLCILAIGVAAIELPAGVTLSPSASSSAAVVKPTEVAHAYASRAAVDGQANGENR
jgi:hypothetical protein